MTKVEFTRDRLRVQFSHLLDEYEAMIVFLAQMDNSVKEQLEAQRTALPSLSKRQLQVALPSLSRHINKIRREHGASRPVGDYAVLLRRALQGGGQVLKLPAYVAVSLFRKYPRVAQALNDHELPPHVFLELDYRGQYERQDRLQLHILEAMLFEDMCFFWNESSGITLHAEKPYSQKRELKRMKALVRAAVSSAFYMVEAFCNGIALEVVLTRRDSLNERERQMVTEWDDKKSRAKYLGIRDKLLHYPRLLLGVTSPPVQENNSPELSFFLSSAKDLRDAIVHANPALSPDTFVFKKAQALDILDQVECGKVIDCAIAVVDQIATAIDRRKSVFWLQSRRSDGLFDESVFD